MLKKIIILILILAVIYLAGVWFFTDWSIPGSKQCKVNTDCELILNGVNGGCWSREPIKIGALEVGDITDYIGCECVNSKCEIIHGGYDNL